MLEVYAVCMTDSPSTRCAIMGATLKTSTMIQFTKTRLHVASAVLFLLVIYALAGFIYAAFLQNLESALIWTTVGGLALVAGLLIQLRVSAGQRAKKKNFSADAEE